MRSVSLVLCASLLGGCSLFLDFDPERLACDAEGACRPGFVCNGQNECMAEGHPSTLCNPDCGPLAICVRAACIPICDGRACEAGSSCVDGACVKNPVERNIGSPCRAPTDCRQAGTTCLVPYGGGEGVCTRICEGDVDCTDGRAPQCVTFPNGRGGRKLCADPSFAPCANEATCNDSGLSCGVFALDADLSGDPILEPISACRPRIAKEAGSQPAGIGETCSPSIPCSNGLCVPINSAGEQRCTTPCADRSDCENVLGKPTDATQSHACAQVVLTPGNESFPRLRTYLCSPNGVSAATPCTKGISCNADAPYCVTEPGKTTMSCMSACDDTPIACPTDAPNCIPQADSSQPDVCAR